MRYLHSWKARAFFLGIFLVAVLYTQAQNQEPRVTVLRYPLFGFYAKFLNCQGLPIRSSRNVSSQALLVACDKLDKMLEKIPEVRTNLRQWGVELHVIGKKENTSDLPEYRSEKGKYYIDNRGMKTTIDERTRGKGGIYASCGEENLLQLPGDRYTGGYDICIHEFAHAIMDYGLDEALEQQIEDRYHQAVAKGLWKNAYASENQGEFWAELSMWYFGSHGEYLEGTKRPAPGPDALKEYDRESYLLMDSIYSGVLKTTLMNVLPALPVSSPAGALAPGRKAYAMIVNNSAETYTVKLIDQNGVRQTGITATPHSRNIQETYLHQTLELVGQETKRRSLWRINTPFVSITPTVGRPLKQKKK